MIAATFSSEWEICMSHIKKTKVWYKKIIVDKRTDDSKYDEGLSHVLYIDTSYKLIRKY